jgi:hypothetical protein
MSRDASLPLAFSPPFMGASIRSPDQPGSAAACFTQRAICASSSSSSSWMSM